MNRTNVVSNCINLMKATKNLLRGELLGTRPWYDSRYPPTKFLARSLPRINVRCIICGYPRTGTHWIMHVIEKSAGQRTYDLFYKKPTLSDKDVCLLKIHARSKLLARAKALWLLPRHNFGSKYIYVYRDPRDAIISLYEMYKTKKGLTTLKPLDFLKLRDPIRQYRWEINAWVLKNHKNVLLVRFEDLKAKPVTMFQRMLTYLDLDASVNTESVGKKVAVHDSKNRLRATAYGWKHAPSEYTAIIDSVNTNLCKEIKLLGYQDA